MKFRKKPVVIEAWEATYLTWAAEKSWKDLPKQISDAYEKGNIIFESNGRMHIHILEGILISEPGDLIICGVKGELYPCKPDIFEMTYETMKAEGNTEGRT